MNDVHDPSRHPAPAPDAASGPAAGTPSPLERAVGFGSPYLVGIGGCGMSALARLLAADGVAVRGVDSTPTKLTADLDASGIPVDLDGSGLPDDARGLVISAAVKPDHPLVLDAQRRGLPVLTYAEALGRVMQSRTGIAIAGTHGKSTTTAMLGCALTDAGLDPSVIVGATCGQLESGCLAHAEEGRPPGGYRMGAATVPEGPLAGRPGFLLAESCEFNRSFHNHRPTIAAIPNLEADHLDIYGSLDAVVEAFAGFARLVPPSDQGGRLLIGHDSAHRRVVTAGLDCAVETIGFSPSADWVVRYDPAAGAVEITGPDGLACGWRSLMPGEHNAMNSAVAAAIALGVGADPDRVSASLSAFRGLDRRLQFLGGRAHPRGEAVRVYDDYGHHPTEIDATLRALRQHEQPEARGARLIVVFQPHQHSRTRFLLDEFATSFGQADAVIVPHIYFVRDSEAEKQKVSAADLVDRLRGKGVQAMHLYPFEAIVEQLENVCQPGDVLVVMGAGPVWKVAHEYLAGGGSGGDGDA